MGGFGGIPLDVFQQRLSNLITSSLVEDQSLTEMLVNGTLTIKCDIDAFVGVKTIPGRDLRPPASMADEISHYLQMEEARDLTLKLGSDAFPVNRFMLCARAKVGGITAI